MNLRTTFSMHFWLGVKSEFKSKLAQSSYLKFSTSEKSICVCLVFSIIFKTIITILFKKILKILTMFLINFILIIFQNQFSRIFIIN